jgi:CBS domain-containing protein
MGYGHTLLQKIVESSLTGIQAVSKDSLAETAYPAYDVVAFSNVDHREGVAMKPVLELLKKRDSALYSVAPDVMVFDGLKLLASYGVGAMVVLDQSKLVGVFSERDYTRKVALQGKNSREIPISDIMTRNVITVPSNARTKECMTLMSQHKIRHLPVMDGGKVLALLSIRDIMDDIIADHEETITHLQTYISG